MGLIFNQQREKGIALLETKVNSRTLKTEQKSFLTRIYKVRRKHNPALHKPVSYSTGTVGQKKKKSDTFIIIDISVICV